MRDKELGISCRIGWNCTALKYGLQWWFLRLCLGSCVLWLHLDLGAWTRILEAWIILVALWWAHDFLFQWLASTPALSILDFTLLKEFNKEWLPHLWLLFLDQSLLFIEEIVEQNLLLDIIEILKLPTLIIVINTRHLATSIVTGSPQIRLRHWLTGCSHGGASSLRTWCVRRGSKRRKIWLLLTCVWSCSCAKTALRISQRILSNWLQSPAWVKIFRVCRLGEHVYAIRLNLLVNRLPKHLLDRIVLSLQLVRLIQTNQVGSTNALADILSLSIHHWSGSTHGVLETGFTGIGLDPEICLLSSIAHDPLLKCHYGVQLIIVTFLFRLIWRPRYPRNAHCSPRSVLLQGWGASDFWLMHKECLIIFKLILPLNLLIIIIFLFGFMGARH